MAAVVVETGGGGGGSNCEVSPAQVEKAAGALCPLRLYLPNLVMCDIIDVMCKDIKMISMIDSWPTEILCLGKEKNIALPTFHQN